MHAPHSSSRRRFLALALAMVALPVLILAPALLPSRRLLPVLPCELEPLATESSASNTGDRPSPAFVGADVSRLAEDVALARARALGDLGTWEPHVGVGTRLSADRRTGAWYPLNLAAWSLPIDRARLVSAFVALVLAGTWWRLYLRDRGRGEPAALVGAWVAQASGFALAHLSTGAALDAALWWPLTWLGFERIASGRRLGVPIAAAAIAMSWLAGAPLVAALGTACSIVFVTASAWRARRIPTWPVRRRSVLVSATLALALGFAAATVEWWPAAVARSESLAALPDATRIERERLPIATVATWLVPDLFGSVHDDHATPRDPIPWSFTGTDDVAAVRAADATNWCVSAGIAALSLAIVAFVSRPRASLAPFALLVVGLGLAQAWPGFRAIESFAPFTWGPLWHATALTWAAFVWAGAIGVDAILDARPRARATAIVVASVLFVCAAGAAVTFRPAREAAAVPDELARRHGVSRATAESVVSHDAALAGFERVQDGLVRLAILAGGTLVAAVVSSRARTGARSLVRLAPWAVVVAGDALTTSHAFVAVRDLGDRALFPASEALDAIAEAAGDGRVLRFDAHGTGDAIVSPSVLRAYGIADLSTDGPYPDTDLAQFAATIDPTSLRSGGVGSFTDERVWSNRALDTLRVTCVLSRAPLRAKGLRLAFQRDGLCVYARATALPLARLAPPTAIVASSPVAAQQLVAEADRDPRGEVVLEADAPSYADALRACGWNGVPSATDPLHEAERTAASRANQDLATEDRANDMRASDDVEITRPSPSRLDARIHGGAGGWLVFHERFADGWHARVDGRDAPLVRADHLYRAVAIPPGDVVVETWFAPRDVVWGGWITLIASIAIVASSWRTRPPARSVEAAPARATFQ